MRTLSLIVVTSLVSVAACGSHNTATKEESLLILAAATDAMSSAQMRALSDAQQGLQAPAEVMVNFSGPCTLGGRVGMTGSVENSDTSDRVAVDLRAVFDGCREPQAALDGDLHTTSTVDGSNVTVTLKGDLDWEDGNGASASCEFDMRTAVTAETVVVSGHLCGFDVAVDLGLNN